MASPISSPTKDQYHLVKLTHGGVASPILLTDWDSNVDRYLAGSSTEKETYQSLTQMEIKYSKEDGGVSDAPLQIDIPNGHPFAVAITTRGPFQEVEVEVFEILEENGARSIESTFTGKIALVSKNLRDKKGFVRLRAHTYKADMNHPMGMGMNPKCGFTYGVGGCGSMIPQTEQAPGTITAIDRLDVTITGLPPKIDRWWHRGHIKYDGIIVDIFNWKSGEVFRLREKLPLTWIGRVVTVVPGCYKSEKSCNERGQLESFVGIARKMPNYNPGFEK